MPIEQGIVLLIQSGLGSPPIAPGGWNTKLPQNLLSDLVPMAWTYRTINSGSSYTLTVQDGWTALEIQIDCHGMTAALAQTLADSIQDVLRGAPALTLDDDDSTVVQGIFSKDTQLDGYSDENRSYVRTLEYTINFQDDAWTS